jgi:hypothetical protein
MYGLAAANVPGETNAKGLIKALAAVFIWSECRAISAKYTD